MCAIVNRIFHVWIEKKAKRNNKVNLNFFLDGNVCFNLLENCISVSGTYDPCSIYYTFRLYRNFGTKKISRYNMSLYPLNLASYNNLNALLFFLLYEWNL